MIRRRRHVALLVIAVLASGFLAWQLRPQPKPPKPVQERSDYVLREFELTLLDEAGIESFTVSGPHLERDPQGKSLTLTKPRFSFPDEEGGRWDATSATAWVSPKADEVRLLDEVLMLGPKSEAGIQARFETDRLDVFPKENRAVTDSPVTVTQGGSILQGTGLRADLQAERIQLLADVKGRYAPRRR